MHFFFQVIEKRRNIYEKNKNQEQNVPKRNLVFLDLCFEIQKKNPASFDDNDIYEEANTFILAGHETTAAAISFCIYSLAKYPEIQVSQVSFFNHRTSGQKPNSATLFFLVQLYALYFTCTKVFIVKGLRCI